MVMIKSLQADHGSLSNSCHGCWFQVAMKLRVCREKRRDTSSTHVMLNSCLYGSETKGWLRKKKKRHIIMSLLNSCYPKDGHDCIVQ